MQADTVDRWGLRIAGALGLAVFAGFFALTFSRPQWLETFARDYIESEVRERIEARIEGIVPLRGESALAGLAADLYRRNQAEIEKLKARLEQKSRDLFTVALNEVRNLDCECRKRIELAWTAMNQAHLLQLLTDNQRVVAFIQGDYMSVVNELEAEARIFTATNAAAFLLLLLVSFAKPAASRHLLFPGVLLFAATLFCVWLYLFSQNWLLTIISGDYVGWAYTGYLALVYAFLLDIAFNRGRVTSAAGNGVSSLFGSAANLTPC